MLDLIETSNSAKLTEFEILEANQAMKIKGGVLDGCSGCDGTGGVKPPATPPPTKKPLE